MQRLSNESVYMMSVDLICMRLLSKKLFQILTIDCFKSVLVFETCFVVRAIQFQMWRQLTFIKTYLTSHKIG